MKRAFILLIIPLLLLRLPVQAQDAGTAAAIAAREAAEERYKRMAADLQAVQSDNEALHAKLTAMGQEIQTLRDAQAHSADNSGIQDELKRLAEKIQEVDKKRMEDKEAISEEIHKSISGLDKLVAGGPAPVPARVRAAPARISAVPDTQSAEKGYSYTIKEGDTLGAVVKAYNEDYKSKGLKTISLRQAEDANPNVDWGRLRVGQKIVVPLPNGG